jgi:tetratricopeptide (TPR) repeat protein
LLRGHKNLKEGKYKEALNDCLSALKYPDNMIIDQAYRGGRTCEVYRFIGLVYEKMGNSLKAREAWNEAVSLRESDRRVSSETDFYRASSLKKLGRKEEAEQLFDGLILSGKARIEAEQIDFFEKFGERGTQDDRKI